jgi:hypothetical protein
MGVEAITPPNPMAGLPNSAIRLPPDRLRGVSFSHPGHRPLAAAIRSAAARRLMPVLGLALLGLPAADRPVRPAPVLWAWERPEDLRFAGPDVTIAVLAGSLTLSGDAVLAAPRRQPALLLPDQQRVAVIHVEIDRHKPLAWTAAQRQAAAAAALAYAGDLSAHEVQLDFEVRESERQVLLDLAGDLRAGLGSDQRLSMTALASWCDTERWIEAAPVDEIVPMLFRMGPGGVALKQRLAEGGDFHDRRCRQAIGIATDTPPAGLPAGRRLYVFNPRRWNAADYATLIQETARW